MGQLFQEEIHGWTSWGRLFQSIDAFRPLIQAIFRREGLPMAEITHLTPGTNAVFRVGRYVVKIFAPAESGMDMNSDYVTELFGIERANRLGVPSPSLQCAGTLMDRYVFRYLVMDYVEGEALRERHGQLTRREKVRVGDCVRILCGLMNRPSGRFNAIHVLNRALGSPKWSAFSPGFLEERTEYLQTMPLDPLVYVHGDITDDNLLLDARGRILLLDYADALLAPAWYEWAALFCGAFRLDPAYLEGFFQGPMPEDAIERCLHAILLHDFGPGILADIVGHDVHSAKNLDAVRTGLHDAFQRGAPFSSNDMTKAPE